MSVLSQAPDYIRFLTAEEWGMDWERPPVREELGDNEVYVHHRAGNPRHGVDAVQAFYEMNEGAQLPKDQGGKGYSATDYDFLVHEHESGLITVGEARGEWLSAATRDRNEQGEAVCALGYFHPGHSLSAWPSDRMIEGIAWAIAWGVELGFIDREAVILGHRDNPAHPGATGCPGDYLYARLDDIRRLVEEIFAEPTPEPPEEDNMPAREMIVKPPSNWLNMDDKGRVVPAPWFYVWNGDVRYAVKADVDAVQASGGAIVNESAERYLWMFRQVFGKDVVLAA